MLFNIKDEIQQERSVAFYGLHVFLTARLVRGLTKVCLCVGLIRNVHVALCWEQMQRVFEWRGTVTGSHPKESMRCICVL